MDTPCFLTAPLTHPAALCLPPALLQRVLGVLLGGDVRQNVMRVSAVAGVVVLRTLLQDRIASLNGRSVDLVLRQELGAFVRWSASACATGSMVVLGVTGGLSTAV